MQASWSKPEMNQKLRARSLRRWQDLGYPNFCGPKYGAGELEAIKGLAKHIREKCQVFLLVGVGGSNGGARAIIEGLGQNKTGANPEIVYAGNSLSPRQMHDLLHLVREKEVCLNVIAKNFQTLEPGSHFRMLRQAMEDKYGREEAAKRIVVTGSKGSLLDHMARDQGYAFLDFEAEVGGRFSVFSKPGLFPMAVAGLEIEDLLIGREEILDQMQDPNHFIHDYVAYRNQAYIDGYKVEVLSAFDLDFREWLRWWVQLFGESEGKDKKGLYPDGLCFSEDLHSMGQFLQEGSPICIETFLRIKNYENPVGVVKSRIKDDFDYLNGQSFARLNRAMEEATIMAHGQAGIPYFILEMQDMSVKEWGHLFAFFMVAVVLSAGILGVNPFDQNGVEAYKQNMFKKLRGKKNGK